MAINQLSIFIENKPGTLVEVTEILAAAGIDIRAMSIADTQDFGILRLIVDDTDKACDALRDNSCIVSVTKVVAVAIDDEPGSLSRVINLLTNNGINIEYLYAFITVSRRYAYIVLRVKDADNEKAVALLTENKIKLVEQSDIKLL